jgi:hypothetical protein
MTTTIGAAPLLAAAQDTVAYVTRPDGPPASEPYMYAGYAITALVYGGYLLLLLRRMANARRPR